MPRGSSAVVLDLLGGDGAPQAAVEAIALARAAGHDVLPCGPAHLGAAEGLIAEVAIPTDADPAFAIRGARDASIRVACRAVAEGRAAAVVSAGPTGATVAAALLELGRSPGIRRPAVGARIPRTNGGHTLMVDVGAITDPDPATLVSHGHLGLGWWRAQGVEQPRIGLLNIGTEPQKGNQLLRAAHALLADAFGDAFVGNVEPDGLMAGDADVVVADGVNGNLVVKALEAARVQAASTDPDTAPAPPIDTAALVLGVRGIVLAAHGAATPAALADAVGLASAVVAAQRPSPDRDRADERDHT